MLKKIFENINFKPLNDYVDKISKKVRIIDIRGTEKCKVINCEVKNDLNLEIIVLDDTEKTCVAFYYKADIDLEKVEYIILKNDLSDDINRTIRHDYWYLENEFLKTYNSFYTYNNNKYKKGIKNVRKVKFQDVNKNILNDNLSYLSFHIDKSNIPTRYKECSSLAYEPVIETAMINNKLYNLEMNGNLLKENDKIKIKK